MVVIDDNVSADLDVKLGKVVWFKPPIAPEVLKELRRNDDSWPGIKYVSMYFASLVATGWLAYLAWERSSWPLAVVFFWMYGTIYTFSGQSQSQS